MNPTFKAARALVQITDNLTAELQERGLSNANCEPFWAAVRSAFMALEAIDEAYTDASAVASRGA